MRPDDDEPIHILIPGHPGDPRDAFEAPEGVVIHRSPPLHPDDVAVVDGLPVTSVARTLVDLAECMPEDELRATFARAQRKGMLDIAAVRASAARAEWRPSLEMLERVIAEFDRG